MRHCEAVWHSGGQDRLTDCIIELAAVYGRYGTPRIGAMLQRVGWRLNHKRVERSWR